MKQFNFDKFVNYIEKFTFDKNDLNAAAIQLLGMLSQQDRASVIHAVAAKINTVLYNQALVIMLYEWLLEKTDRKACRDVLFTLVRKLKEKYPNVLNETPS